MAPVTICSYFGARQNALLGYNFKNNRMIPVHFQGKLLNMTVIQVYAPISNAEEAEFE